MKQRITWIDLCKGYAIILVLLGHSYSSNNMVLIWLNSFHMPLFFMLTGYLFGIRKIYERSFKRVFLDNLQSLLIPYFVYSILLTLFKELLKTCGTRVSLVECWTGKIPCAAVRKFSDVVFSLSVSCRNGGRFASSTARHSQIYNCKCQLYGGIMATPGGGNT